MMHLGTTMRGRVDLAAADRVLGWAFDEGDPDRQVDVSVFVDDLKVAQVRCDIMRRDLLAAGTFGSVGHGFEHRFDPALDVGRAHRVSVRCVDSGRLLDRGDVMLPDGTPATAADFGQSLPPAFPVLPAPVVPRDWFNLLALLEESQGLYNLLARCDMTGRRPDQVLYSVLGDTPGARPNAEPWNADPWNAGPWNASLARETAYDALTSPAFQRNVRDLLLNAFAEKRRRFFIHVPKCAGTDLSAHLSVRFPAIHQSLTNRDYVSRQRLFEELSHLVRIVPYFDFILVHGHINLGGLLSSRLLRPIDEMFTTLRNPIDITLSQTNYILTRILNDAERGAFGPDSRTWLAGMDLTVTPADVTRPMLDDLRLRLLRDASINRPDTMCEWLGGGTAPEVLDRLTDLDAEVTTTRHYGAWLAEKWQIRSATRRNESIPFLRRENLATAELDYLHDISVQDRQLYAAVEKRIEDTGAASVFMGRARMTAAAG